MRVSSAAGKVRVGQYEISVDYSSDLYGPDWWTRVSGGEWENSTLGFVEFGIHPGSTFIDLGAASGLLSLIAALRGARVLAVEPHPRWLKTLERNVELNGLIDKIQIIKAAVSSKDGLVLLRRGAKRSVLSDISLGFLEAQEGDEVKVVSLISLLETYEKSAGGLLVKIDIEGAEYAIFDDFDTLRALEVSGARVLLSLHPGFPYAREISSTVGAFLQHYFLRIRGLVDNMSLYYRVRKFAVIKLVNGDSVRAGWKFVLLTSSGYLDFVLCFGDQDTSG